MNNWKLRSTITGQDGMDFVEVNGHLSCYDQSEDCLVQIVPFGDKYPYYLRTSASDDFGPVSNQVPGICNGTFTHTGAASGTVASVVLEGESNATPNFTYTFLADGTLSTIVAAQGGDRNIRVGDKYQITTTAAHGSQVIQFRLVPGSNSRAISMRLIHDQGVLPYAVHRVKITETDEDHTIQVLDYRSSQVFPKPQDKLLDKYPDAAAAYGLRLLRSAYLGPAIRVRRESTGWPEIDVYFDSQGNLDTKALLDFAGTSSVRVKTWYDQSGGGNDATQSTNASQPTIVNGGVLSTVNGKPALKFDGSDDGFSADHTDIKGQARFDAYMHYQTDDQSYTMFTQSAVSGSFSFVAQNGGTSTDLTGNYGGTDVELYVNGVKANLVDGTTDRDDLNTIMVDNAASHSNGAIIVHQDALTTSWTGFLIGNYGGALHFDGKMTEMVLYNTDQSANREDIEKDMALHSGAFQVEDAPLLDAYGGAHAAYSLRKLNSDYTGAAIRIRKGGTAEEKDVGFDANGNIDEATIFGFGTQDVYVTKWYDQSGNGNDLVQSTTAKQPHLRTVAGVEQRVDGRLAMRFDGSSDSLPFDSTGLDIGNLSTFVTCKFASLEGTQFVLRLSATTGDKRWFAPLLQGTGDWNYMYGVYSTTVTATANTNNNLHTMIAGATQGDFEAFLNGTSLGTRNLTTGLDDTATDVGSQGGTQSFLNGFIQEIVVYSSDQSERREGIERNISNHYDL